MTTKFTVIESNCEDGSDEDRKIDFEDNLNKYNDKSVVMGFQHLL